ncbi:hypothetical protein BC827DRAFT_1179509 [Russula dissimulans]|nr:hypothetical protein BC827DRAFT_1179509 [Russula dissimulans]
MVNPADAIAPPSYQMSLEHFDHKTARAAQRSSSTSYLVDEDGWPIYDPAAFETAGENSGSLPPTSSSAGILGAGAPHETQGRLSDVKTLASTQPMKTRSSERRRRNPRPDDEYAHEPRVVTPPPPFTPTGPSLDGPPFEEVVRMSYDGSDSQAASPIQLSYQLPPRSPPPLPMQMLPPVEPLRLAPHRLSDSQINPYPPPRPSPMLDIRPNPTSTITRVEFDPQMAYSPYGRMGNHTSLQGATAFYNHAVASQLATSPSTSSSTPSNYRESRISSPYASGASSTIHQGQASSSSVSPHEQYASHSGYCLSSPVSLPPPPRQSHPASSPPGPGRVRSSSGFGRGPLPPVPGSNVPLSHPQWGESNPQLVEDAYGGHG